MTPGPRLQRTFRIGREVHDVDLRLEAGASASGEGGVVTGSVNGAPVTAEVRRAGPSEVVVRWAGRRVAAVVARRGESLLISWEGRAYEWTAAAHGSHGAHGAHGAAGGPSGPSGPSGPVEEPYAVSPMTGLLVKMHAAAGEPVAKGAPLFVVEAMKMEYVVRADRDVVVEEVRRAAGARVDVGEVIVTYREEPEGDAAPEGDGK